MKDETLFQMLIFLNITFFFALFPAASNWIKAYGPQLQYFLSLVKDGVEK